MQAERSDTASGLLHCKYPKCVQVFNSLGCVSELATRIRNLLNMKRSAILGALMLKEINMHSNDTS